MNLCKRYRNVPDPEILGTNIDNFKTFYYETAGGKYVPKALFIDTEPSVIDALRQSSLGNMIHSNYMINNTQDCRNVFGLAWYPTYCGMKFHEQVNKNLRALREVCDTLSGNIYYLTTCGGTGSGFTCKALKENRKLDPKAVNYAICHGPSPTINGVPLETYNTIAYMGLSRYDNLNMNMHMMYDNEALYRQCNRLYGAKLTPTFKHLNQLIAVAMSSCTASLRYDGQLNVDLNEFQTNLIPIPTLNNMFTSFAPLDMDEDKEVMSTKDITIQAFEPAAYMCSVDPFAWSNSWPVEEDQETWASPPWLDEESEIARELENSGEVLPTESHTIAHKFLACCVMYRGDLMPATINRAMQTLTSEKKPMFAPWVPSGFKVGINSPPMRTPISWPLKDMSRSLTCVINNTVICEKFKQLIRNYRFIKEFNGYACWTVIGGIEESLLDGCKDGINSQISQYQYCMSTQLPIEEIQEQLKQKPQPMGNF